MRSKINLSRVLYFFLFFVLVGSTTYAFFGPLASGQKSKAVAEVTVNLVDPHWREDGGAELAVDAVVKNISDHELKGELRTTLLAFNGSIDFDHVKVKQVEQPESYHRPDSAPDNIAFFVAPDYSIKGHTEEAWSFTISLPPGVRAQGVPLQILVFYHGLDENGQNWLSKGFAYLPTSGN